MVDGEKRFCMFCIHPIGRPAEWNLDHLLCLFPYIVDQRYKALHKYEYLYETESLNAINGASNLQNGPKASCKVRSHAAILFSLFHNKSDRGEKKLTVFFSSTRLRLKCHSLVTSSFVPLVVVWVRWLTRGLTVAQCSHRLPHLTPSLPRWRSKNIFLTSSDKIIRYWKPGTHTVSLHVSNLLFLMCLLHSPGISWK